MTIEWRKGYVLVEAPWLVWVCALATGNPSRGRAAAIFPFVIVRSMDEDVPWLINHERIHFRQQVETLFIGVFLMSLMETLYAVLWMRMSVRDAYRWRANEQEAYRNQHDLHYLEHRPRFALFTYITDKKPFVIIGPGEIQFVEKCNLRTR